MVPWEYKPLYRQFSYYQPLTLGIAAVARDSPLCAVRRERLAQGVVAVAILVHLACLAAGGRCGQAVDVSRELLAYAREHSDQTFLTDVATMNQMYVVGGFRLPANVVCLNGPAVDRYLLVNNLLVNPDGPRFHFPEVPIDNILLNLEQISGFHYYGLRSLPSKTWQEPDFSGYLEEHGAGRVRIAPVRYRLLFLPLIPLIGPKDFLVKNLGGEVVRVQRGCTGRTTPPPPPPPPSPGCCAAPPGALRAPVFDFLGDVGPLAAPGLDFAALAAWLVEDPSRLGAVLRRLQADPNRRPGELRDDFRAITEGSGVSPEDLARLVSSFWGDLRQIDND